MLRKLALGQALIFKSILKMQLFGKTQRVKTTTLLFLLLGFLTSCDCMQQLQGYAIDAETGTPLSGVVYSRDRPMTEEEKMLTPGDPMYSYLRQTDSTGWFLDFRLEHGRCCKPHLVLWFEKEGYEPSRVEWQRHKSNMDTLRVALHRKEIR